jgi:hypothetical protein
VTALENRADRESDSGQEEEWLAPPEERCPCRGEQDQYSDRGAHAEDRADVQTDCEYQDRERHHDPAAESAVRDAAED